MSNPELIPISKIRGDGGTQPRCSLNQQTVQQYVERIKEGDELPPVDVFFDGAEYWLADGFHRVKARSELGMRDISSVTHQGTQLDAQWFSYASNKTHGLPRTQADKVHVIKACLRHPKGRSQTDNAIAEHLGVDQKTVAKYRRELVAAQEIPHVERRTGLDNKSYPAACSESEPSADSIAPCEGVLENSEQAQLVQLDCIEWNRQESAGNKVHELNTVENAAELSTAFIARLKECESRLGSFYRRTTELLHDANRQIPRKLRDSVAALLEFLEELKVSLNRQFE